TDLLADDGFPGGDPPGDESFLDAVGVLDGDLRLTLDQRLHRAPREPGLIQLLAVVLDFLIVHFPLLRASRRCCGFRSRTPASAHRPRGRCRTVWSHRRGCADPAGTSCSPR